MRGAMCLVVLAAGCVGEDEGEDAWVEGSGTTAELEAGAAGGRIDIERLSWDIDVWDAVASGCLEVSMTTTSGTNQSASFRFALPAGAVIHRAEARIAAEERWEPAETLGRSEGQDVFDDVVWPSPEQDPLLLQQVGPSSYRARAYPVGLEQPAAFRVCAAMPFDVGGDRDVLPILTPDRYDPFTRVAVAVDVVVRLHDGGRVGEAWISHLGAGRLGGAEPSFEAAELPLTEPLSLLIRSDAAASPLVALAYDAPAEGIADHVLVRWRPDLDAFPGAAGGPRNVVFVIDSSGSMEGAKMRETLRTVEAALLALGPEDRFGLVDFDTRVSSFRDGLTGIDDLLAARRWLEGRKAQGDTNLAGGLARAAAIGAHSEAAVDVLLVTDGRPTVGALAAPEIVDEVEAASASSAVPRIFAVGIGRDLDRALLADLSDHQGGEATFALEDSEIAPQVLSLFDRVRPGGVADVEVALSGGGIEGAPVFAWPRVFAGTTFTLAATGPAPDGPVTVALTGTVAGQPIDLAAEATPLRGADGPFLAVPPLAAAAWSDQLNRQLERNGETRANVDDAVVLGKKYGVLGRYTSLLALENDAMYAQYGIERIERDAAGIALEGVGPSRADESRIGGEGVDGEGDFGGDDYSASSSGCACRAAGFGPDGTGSALVVVLLALTVTLRPKRNGRETGLHHPRAAK